VIDFSGQMSASIDVVANKNLTASAGVTLSAGVALGTRYSRKNGFSVIRRFEPPSLDFDPIQASVPSRVETTVTLRPRLIAEFYSVTPLFFQPEPYFSFVVEAAELRGICDILAYESFYGVEATIGNDAVEKKIFGATFTLLEENSKTFTLRSRRPLRCSICSGCIDSLTAPTSILSARTNGLARSVIPPSLSDNDFVFQALDGNISPSETCGSGSCDLYVWGEDCVGGTCTSSFNYAPDASQRTTPSGGAFSWPDARQFVSGLAPTHELRLSLWHFQALTADVEMTPKPRSRAALNSTSLSESGFWSSSAIVPSGPLPNFRYVLSWVYDLPLGSSSKALVTAGIAGVMHYIRVPSTGSGMFILGFDSPNATVTNMCVSTATLSSGFPGDGSEAFCISDMSAGIERIRMTGVTVPLTVGFTTGSEAVLLRVFASQANEISIDGSDGATHTASIPNGGFVEHSVSFARASFPLAQNSENAVMIQFLPDLGIGVSVAPSLSLHEVHPVGDGSFSAYETEIQANAVPYSWIMGPVSLLSSAMALRVTPALSSGMTGGYTTRVSPVIRYTSLGRQVTFNNPLAGETSLFFVELTVPESAALELWLRPRGVASGSATYDVVLHPQGAPIPTTIAPNGPKDINVADLNGTERVFLRVSVSPTDAAFDFIGVAGFSVASGGFLGTAMRRGDLYGFNVNLDSIPNHHGESQWTGAELAVQGSWTDPVSITAFVDDVFWIDDNTRPTFKLSGFRVRVRQFAFRCCDK
jgi:hypothetical protein